MQRYIVFALWMAAGAIMYAGSATIGFLTNMSLGNSPITAVIGQAVSLAISVVLFTYPWMFWAARPEAKDGPNIVVGVGISIVATAAFFQALLFGVPWSGGIFVPNILSGGLVITVLSLVGLQVMRIFSNRSDSSA